MFEVFRGVGEGSRTLVKVPRVMKRRFEMALKSYEELPGSFSSCVTGIYEQLPEVLGKVPEISNEAPIMIEQVLGVFTSNTTAET